MTRLSLSFRRARRLGALAALSGAALSGLSGCAALNVDLMSFAFGEHYENGGRAPKAALITGDVGEPLFFTVAGAEPVKQDPEAFAAAMAEMAERCWVAEDETYEIDGPSTDDLGAARWAMTHKPTKIRMLAFKTVSAGAGRLVVTASGALATEDNRRRIEAGLARAVSEGPCASAAAEPIETASIASDAAAPPAADEAAPTVKTPIAARSATASGEAAPARLARSASAKATPRPEVGADAVAVADAAKAPAPAPAEIVAVAAAPAAEKTPAPSAPTPTPTLETADVASEAPTPESPRAVAARASRIAARAATIAAEVSRVLDDTPVD